MMFYLDEISVVLFHFRTIHLPLFNRIYPDTLHPLKKGYFLIFSYGFIVAHYVKSRIYAALPGWTSPDLADR